ncbi:hypothetical protein B7654_003749 [Escherichia coli]|nr:hypothetical protein [Escherichia coli]EFF2795799.1 hypothetical protein [Escherichia coli]EFF2922009.1 hypothetical protein [Escherichia coli]EFF3114329.1 hypothetical protein [Escherichia coli]EFF3128729.1 hypothetical protein [Escherichia coli]
MIIAETKRCYGVRLDLDGDVLWLTELMGTDTLVIDKEQAAELISALQLYVNNEFKNDEVE